MSRAIDAYRDWRGLKQDERVGIGFEAAMCVLLAAAAGTMGLEISGLSYTAGVDGPEPVGAAVVTVSVAGLGLAFFFGSWTKLRLGRLRLYLARDGEPSPGALAHAGQADAELRRLNERLGRLCQRESVTTPGFAALLARYERLLQRYRPGTWQSRSKIRELDAEVRGRLDSARTGIAGARKDSEGGSESE